MFPSCTPTTTFVTLQGQNASPHLAASLWYPSLQPQHHLNAIPFCTRELFHVPSVSSPSFPSRSHSNELCQRLFSKGSLSRAGSGLRFPVPRLNEAKTLLWGRQAEGQGGERVLSVPDRVGRLGPPSVGKRNRSTGPKADRKTTDRQKDTEARRGGRNLFPLASRAPSRMIFQPQSQCMRRSHTHTIGLSWG